MYARDEINIRANVPSPLLPQSSVQKGGGGAHFQELTVQERISSVMSGFTCHMGQGCSLNHMCLIIYLTKFEVD